MVVVTRWGVKGRSWREVREIPRGEQVARDWAKELSSGRNAEEVTLFRGAGFGSGWVAVEVFPVAVSER